MILPMNASCDPYGWHGNFTWMPPTWNAFLHLELGFELVAGVADTILAERGFERPWGARDSFFFLT
uniref:Uncharacterized protein n=1 Tax=Rhizophora mucronata TaxID=61149 RepID=A0A2P2PCL3_RHIMU